MSVCHIVSRATTMSTAALSNVCDEETDGPQLGEMGKTAPDSSVEPKSFDNALPSPKLDNLTDVLDSVKDNLNNIDANAGYDLFDDCLEDGKSSITDEQEQLRGSQGSSESDDVFYVVSDGGEADALTDSEKTLDEETNSIDLIEKEALDKEPAKDGGKSDSQARNTQNEIPFEETLSCDLHVPKKLTNSECSTDSSDLLNLTAEEEKVCPSANDSILYDEDPEGQHQSQGAKSEPDSSVVKEIGPLKSQESVEQSVESDVDMNSRKGTSTSQESQDVERSKETEIVDNLDGSSNSNFSGSTDLESRAAVESTLNKNLTVTNSSMRPTQNSPAGEPEAVPLCGNAMKTSGVDVRSALLGGLFKDDSLEEFSLSPKDVSSLKSDAQNAGIEVNVLREADQGMSIEDIIDNLSSPIGEEASSSAVDGSLFDKNEVETMEEVAPPDDKQSNKRLADSDSLSSDEVETKKAKLDLVDTSKAVDEDISEIGEAETADEILTCSSKESIESTIEPDSISNDKVEVKKVKLDIVLGDKTADAENSDETRNAVSSTASAEVEKEEDMDVNGGDPKMDMVCDDDIDIIEEKCPEKKEENHAEKEVKLDVKEVKLDVKEVKLDVKEVQLDVSDRNASVLKENDDEEEKPEVKVNGIAIDHSDEDDKGELLHITMENVEELVIKRIADATYEDYLNTTAVFMKKIDTLERNLEKAKKRLSFYQNMLGNLSTEHRRQLAKLGYSPKIHTRTVGVNVRILQEHELQSPNRLRMVKDNLITPSASTTPAPSVPVPTSTSMQLAQATAKKCILPRATTPSGLTLGPRMPAPNVTVSQITVNTTGMGNDEKIRAPSSMQIIPNVSQGMTNPQSMMNRPRMQPSILRRQPVPKSPGSVTSTASIVLLSNPPPNTSTVTSSSSINVIDLTEDGDSSLTTTTAATSQSSAMLVSPSVARGPSSNLVPMPLVGSLNPVVQIIPSGAHMSTSISGGNTIRVTRPNAVLPNASCMPPTRVAYLLPQNSGTLVMPRMDGQVSQIGNLQPHQSPFVTSSGQHVPTILLRMNAPPSNPVVSSNAVSTTKPTVTQSNAPVSLPSGNAPSSTMLISCVTKHPAPLPPAPSYPENKNLKCLPPKPALKISKVSNGIVLSWNMSLFNSHADIATYQLFAYQESNQAVTSSLWKKVGDVKALPLPMACTLTQFVEGHKYHFAVRAVDIHGRIGPFSDPSSIVLLPRSGQIPSK